MLMNGENFFTKRTFTEWIIIVFSVLLIFSGIWAIATYETGTPLWVMSILSGCAIFLPLTLIVNLLEKRRKRKNG